MRRRPWLLISRSIACFAALSASSLGPVATSQGGAFGLPAWASRVARAAPGAWDGYGGEKPAEAASIDPFARPPAQSGCTPQHRLSPHEAGVRVREGACGAVYEDDDGAFWRCLLWLEHLEPVPQPIALDDDLGVDPELQRAEQACAQEGFLPERLPSCIHALATYLAAARDGDEERVHQIIVSGSAACHPSVLCQL